MSEEMNKNQIKFKPAGSLFFNSALVIMTAAAAEVFAQMPTPVPAPETEDYTWWYVTLFVLLLGLVGAIGWWLNSKNSDAAAAQNANSNGRQSSRDYSEDASVDAEKELEWLRKNNDIVNRRGKKKNARQKLTETMAHPSQVFNGNGNGSGNSEQPANANIQNAPVPQLPIYGFQKFEHARPFNLLPLSNDESLLSAIEQTQEEFEEDEEIRELSVRILAAFKTRNSVEALSQVALYDLSSSVRSKAVSILADFDHESVFETILLACADPTREVRASAARGFTRLNFDRADAWRRIVETGEPGRMRHAARAAVEGGFAERVFDRLVHHDPKQVYEAVALLSLLVKAGETEPIFQRLHRDRRLELWRAVLHVIKITDDHGVLNDLYALLEQKGLAHDLKRVVDETIESVGLVAA